MYDSDGYLTGNSLGGENYMIKAIQPLREGRHPGPQGIDLVLGIQVGG